MNLDELYNQIKNCQNCELYKTRNKLVFGYGNPNADIVFVGESPGNSENLEGIPFIGRAGKLLTAFIEKGMELTRENIYITNILKCLPSHKNTNGIRPPSKEEISVCIWILKKQIEIINPKIIITLGNFATQSLLCITEGITKTRGKIYKYQNIPVIPTYHPSYIIRSGGINSPYKINFWNDLKKAKKYIING